jgi:hypothetical protein
MPIDSIFKPVKPPFAASVTDNSKVISCTVYPNPSSDYFTIQSTNTTALSAIVFDMHGSIIRKYNDIAPEQHFSCKDMTAGYYIVSIQTTKGRVNKQLVITH